MGPAPACWPQLDHPAVAIDLSSLGTMLQDLGDLAAARISFARALKIRKKFLGDDHPKTRIVQRLLDALAIEEDK